VELLREGVHRLSCVIPAGLLNGGHYMIRPIAALHREKWIISQATDAALRFDVTLDHSQSELWCDVRSGALAPYLEWRAADASSDGCSLV
jgi:hypothetical protein